MKAMKKFVSVFFRIVGPFHFAQIYILCVCHERENCLENQIYLSNVKSLASNLDSSPTQQKNKIFEWKTFRASNKKAFKVNLQDTLDSS